MTAERANLLIFGGSGPIGQAVTRRSAIAGITLQAASRTGELRVNVGDHRTVAKVVRDVSPQAIVYLVREQGVLGTVGQVASIASAEGVSRFVFASSGAVYGDSGSRPFEETDELRGSSDYAIAKIHAEGALERLSAKTGLSVVSLRIFNVFGDGCGDSLINKLVERRYPRLTMSRTFVRDYVHVDDVADAILLACGNADVTGALNVASGDGLDNVTLAAHADAGSYEPWFEEIVSFSVGSPRRIGHRLQWQPRRSALAELATRHPNS